MFQGCELGTRYQALLSIKSPSLKTMACYPLKLGQTLSQESLGQLPLWWDRTRGQSKRTLWVSWILVRSH